MTIERDPKRKLPSYLDDSAGRGDISREGFGDFDKEFHPAEIEIEGDPAGESLEDQRSWRRGSSADAAARKRFEVHFRMMTIRNRGAASEDYQAPQ